MRGDTDASGDAGLQILGLLNSLAVDVTRVEGSGDDDFGIDDFFVECGVLAFLVIGDDVGVPLRLEPFSDSELVLNGPEQPGLFRCPFSTLVEDTKNFDLCM